jgi:hypothetical protein
LAIVEARWALSTLKEIARAKDQIPKESGNSFFGIWFLEIGS